MLEDQAVPLITLSKSALASSLPLPEPALWLTAITLWLPELELPAVEVTEGRELYRNELQTMAQCQKDNFWPSYGHEFLGNVVYEKQITII